MTMDELRDKAHALPLKPGVYIMQNAASEVIYVGKAKALKNRVSQYFQDQSRHNEKTRAMVSQIDHFDVIVVQSEFEALVLECALIKRHQPHYNILLKDDKGYPYIRLSVREEYPRFSLSARVQDDGARYFGPYGSRGASQGIIDALREALKLPSCSRKFPRDIGKERPCLNYHMGLCDGYCREQMDQSRYAASIEQAVRLLEGKLDEVLDDLTAEMEQAAEELAFERAAGIRDRINAIKLLSKRQKAVAGSLADTDVVGYYRGEVRSCFVVLHYIEGELAAKDWELLTSPLDEEERESVTTLTAQYYGGRGSLPRQILLPCDIEEQVELARMLTEAVGRKVEVLTPQRGAKMDLVRLANENAREEVERATSAEERRSKVTQLLGSLLGMERPPHRIEAFDISNTGNADIVASMTVHIDGRPLKRDYRHFKLRDMEHADDYASMKQVVERRFRRYLDGDEKFGALPDLLLIDGGTGQVRAAMEAMDEVGIRIPAYGMVKDDRHRTRALAAADGREIGIQQNQSLFSLIGRIQEETHRFAIEFHRQQQAGHLKKSELDDIPGVGPRRKAELLGRFKSLKRIKAASFEALAEVIPKSAAQAVYDYFHPGKDEAK
ncbi:MAG: excinuclease ABC subunit UvrC [Oscillospiraceae bacterium]|nr:excinuclease ABC subunit UvrC [Oscillospiraceae bacterium]